VTDALEHKGLGALAASDKPAGKIADWPFETRLAVAEKSGLIRGGCAGCLQSLERIEISTMPTAIATRRRRFPRAMRDGPVRCLCRDEEIWIRPVEKSFCTPRQGRGIVNSSTRPPDRSVAHRPRKPSPSRGYRRWHR